MVIFTMIFGKLAKFPSGGIPYPILTFVALLPWQFFSDALTKTSNSLVVGAGMIQKIYFPRLILPVSAVISGIIDFAVSFIILVFLMIGYRITPTKNLVFLPLFFLLAVFTTLSVGIWLSALNVKYRDVKYIVPSLCGWVSIFPRGIPFLSCP